jgi:hypothetical protein
MAKRKKQSLKIQKRRGTKALPKSKKLSKVTRGKAVPKRAVARAKPKRAPVKKAARPVAPAVETIPVGVIEQSAAGLDKVRVSDSVAEAKPIAIPGQKNADVQSCTSQWLQATKGVSEADSTNLTKNISDFQITTNQEMEQFLWGVVKCLQGKHYQYKPKPDQNSPAWNTYITKLRSGTLHG